MQPGDSAGSYQDGSIRKSEKRVDFGYILKVKPTEFSEGKLFGQREIKIGKF